MGFRLTCMALLCLSLAACESRLNPMNWFGGSANEELEATAAEPVGTDPQFLVGEVIELSVSSVPSGALVTATGLSPRQGYFGAELVEIERADGRILFEFRVMPPLEPTPVGSDAARLIIVAADLSNRDLVDIREIAVQGATNRLTSRR